MANIGSNLREHSLFVFDNTNRSCLDAENSIKDKIIDTAREIYDMKFVRPARDVQQKIRYFDEQMENPFSTASENPWRPTVSGKGRHIQHKTLKRHWEARALS
jgi:hypothetical protein